MNVQTMENRLLKPAQKRRFWLSVNLPDAAAFRRSAPPKLENIAYFHAGEALNWKTADRLNRAGREVLPTLRSAAHV